MTNIEKESIENLIHNRVVVVGVSPAEVNPYGFRFMKGAVLYAPGTLDPVPNTAPIWIGNAGLTADLSVETGGFPLVPGSQISIPSDKFLGLFAVSTVADQHLLWIGV